MGMSALVAALGGVSILFALASYLMAVAGLVHLTWSLIHGIVGVALLGSSVAINLDALRERMHSGEARRAGRYGSSAVASTLLAIGILGLCGFLANRYPTRFDWSEQQVHSLSDQTRKLLAGLDRDVEIVALFSRLESQPIRDFLDRYEYESERFKIVEFADPNERPDLLERFAISPEQLGQGILRVAYGDESVMLDEVTEEALTNTIVKLTRTGEKVVYFLEGHNERAIEGEAATQKDGFSLAADALRNENYRVEKLLLAAKGDVPADADAVIVAGATRPLLSEESMALEKYLGQGGAVLAMIDPRAKTDLVEKLAEWGVELGNDIIVDRQLALFGRATTPFASQYDPSHAISRELRETTLFHVVRSVKQHPGSNGNFTEIVFTGQDSWAERDLERFFSEGNAELGDGDLPGPVPIAVAGTVDLAGGETEEESGEIEEGGETEEGRLVVFGDADFAANELLGAYANRDLFVNSVNWLLGDVEAISIRPNTARGSRLQLTTAQFENIRVFSLFIMPEALAVLGVFIWWSRRQTVKR